MQLPDGKHQQGAVHKQLNRWPEGAAVACKGSEGC